MPTWKEQKQKYKEENLLVKQQKRDKILATLTPEQLRDYDEVHRLYKLEKITAQQLEKDTQRDRLKTAQNLAIDLSYYDLMKPSELKSLHQQIMFCYSISLKSHSPLRLKLFNYQEPLLNMSNVDGFSNWEIDCQTSKLEDEIAALKSRENPYIYLSGDADTEIEEFDESKIYIIGGLVDRNRYKKAALNRAEALGIPSVKLNLKQFAKMKSSQIIAVNHIFEMMTKLHESGSLRQAVLESLPDRKIEEVIGEE